MTDQSDNQKQNFRIEIVVEEYETVIKTLLRKTLSKCDQQLGRTL